jgi:hypothetical protein
LANLTNDKNKNINYLNIMMDKNGLAAGMYNEADPHNTPGDIGGGQNTFWLRDIESPNGAVLASSQGRDVLILKGLLNRETQEGKFAIKYLSNGLSMTYKACDFFLKRTGGKWWIKNAYSGGKVSQIRVETWSLGVTTLKGICPSEQPK